MASTASPALKQWTSIIKRWPVDKVRPQNVAFQTVMQKRIDHLVNPSSVPQPRTVKKNEAAVSAPPPAWNEDRELKQVKTLNTLLENKYAHAFPLASALRYPASNPTYYDDLIHELDEAPSRSYFSKVMNRSKSIIIMYMR
ncbi:hypothetical protein DV737_g714, partial [Chaetothyriales sp. CBS 132003]